MARTAQFTYPLPAFGHTVSRVTALGALFFLLAAAGSVLVRASSRIQRAGAAWAETRRRREEDRKLWELALTDSRVMADLVALSQQTPGEAARIFLR